MTKPTNYSTFPMPARRRAGEAVDVNADFMTTGTLLNTPTLYPSAYLVLTSKGYTNVTEVESRASSLALPRCSNVTERKHYYAGADRVAASLGGGGLKATGSNPGMKERADGLFWESHDRVNGRMLQENDHECIWQSSLPTGEYCKPIDGIPGRMNASVEFYLNDLYDNLKMLAEEQHQEKDVYFYHSDHLGSASWITDGNGIPVQHLQYLPFGEPFVDQHPAGYQERFRFTGKERDEETGYGYFGARYMDHELTAMWLSVDPMADKYPSISPYAYCAWNPVKLVDPDGNEFADFFDRQGKYLGNDGKNDGKVYMLKEGVRAKTENNKVNWGGTLDTKHADQLTSHSDEITMNGDIGMLSRLLYAEFRGQSGVEQRVCADIVLNRVDDSKFPNTVSEVITQKSQFSSLNRNDGNRKYFENPASTLTNSSNIDAWRSCISSAISVSNGFSRGIGCDATLYFSPKSMRPKGSMPSWNFKTLQEVYPQGVNSNSIRCFKYKN